ncbi:MAG: IPT/TIG domain-containing protein [Cyanobacteria bacterium P01_A01_bin.40]
MAAIHTIRPGFTITLEDTIYVGGEEVNLTDEQFELNKHKLEGVESTVIPIDFGSQEQDGECCYPAPHIKNISPNRILTDLTQTITVFGSFFTPDTTVDVDYGSVENVRFVSSNQLLVDINSPSSAGLTSLTFNNGKQTVFSNSLSFFAIPAGLVDLRLGGTDFSNAAIEVDSGMTISRTAEGMDFTVANNYSNWVRFVGDDDAWVWDRSTKKTLSWIFSNTNRVFLGIGSKQNNVSATNQYYHHERLAFMLSTYLSVTYGNNGNPGTGRTQSFGLINKLATDILKLQITNNGDAGGELRLYRLPGSTIADWFNTEELLGTVTLTDLGADANPIMPVVVPRYFAQNLLLGFILENDSV